MIVEISLLKLDQQPKEVEYNIEPVLPNFYGRSKRRTLWQSNITTGLQYDVGAVFKVRREKAVIETGLLKLSFKRRNV